MNILNDIKRFFSKTAVTTKRHNSTPSNIIEYQAKMLSVQSLKDWKMAVMLATNPENPNKDKLQTLYENMLQDNHLGSVIETRIAKTQQMPFALFNKDNERVDDAKQLLESTWFQEFIKLVIGVKFQGTTLIELFELEESGELKEINEIPQRNFNPIKGLILKNAGDEKGISYREGKLANYYIQIGKDYNDLGLFTLTAPIVIAKKLGLGSWLDFIDKYGIPPLFITTDREDDNRLMEIFEMATNFKRNNFMVARGNEKFEIPNLSNNNSAETFDALIKRADNEISKRFLGGTGLTDEKGFVGSVEVQYELAEARFESDRILVKNVINKQLIPLLVKLSPVYKPLENLRFDWDDEDGLTADKLCEYVSKLGGQFEFDPEQVEEITSLKVIGIKGGSTPTENTTSKKKNTKNAKWQLRLAHRALINLYHQNDCDCKACTSDIAHFNAMDLSDWVKVMEQIAKDKYEGKISDDISEDYILKTYNELNKGLKKGRSSITTKVKGATNKVTPESLKMQQNIFKFSGAKNYTMLQDINAILTSDQGKSWNSFKNEVLKLNKKYNKNYLQAEWQTAKQAGYHSANWDDYQRRKHIYPNLKYQTQKDDRVRDEHLSLQGVIAPIDSDFWAVHYPPNGWRCRCYVVQTAEPPTLTKDIPKLTEKQLKKEFRGNVGISGEIFKETNENKGKPHPYFALFKGAGSETKKAFEYSKLAAAKEKAYKADNGAIVKVNPFADLSDFEENFTDAKLIANKLNYGVDIEAHLDGEIAKNHKNPEYLINGKVADRKAPKGLKYKNVLRKAAKQECEYVVINNKNNGDTLKSIRHKLRNVLKQKSIHPTIKKVILIINNKAFEYDRNEI